MDFRTIIQAAVVFALGLGAYCAPARGEIEWRVSVKFILDASGNRPSGDGGTDLATQADVQAQIDAANDVLAAMGRGYRMKLVEVLDLAGLSDLHTSCDKDTLQVLVDLAPEAMLFNSNAINIYVSDGACAGSCSFPESGDDIILIGQGPQTTTFLHESGHFFSLCHTQGCPCSDCSDGVCDTTPDDDEIDDTLPDLACWTQDDIADNAYGSPYNALTSSQQDHVDDVFFNIMSYHGTRDRMTDDQLDEVTDLSNDERSNVATGTTHFVDADNLTAPWYGTSSSPWPWVMAAVAVADDGDVVLVREGSYDETGVIGDDADEAVLLLSTRGTAVIGAP